MFDRVLHIIKKELSIELREKYTFFSSILYLIAITFVVFKVFGKLEGPTKMALFWILLLFTAINMIGFSFSYQTQKRKLNYYQLYDPQELMTAKLIFNFIKVFLAGLVLLLLMYIFSNEPLKDGVLFFKVYILMVLGIVVVLNLISAISSYNQNQNTLVAVLSLPLLIPILLLGMRVSLISERMFSDSGVAKYLLMLSGIDLLLLTLSIIFIPIVWKS
ncbi:MAG: ABC transporter permease [Saprospiraceae bacterium]|nr:ABC transporter permease [Bacteroidia bacterium]NNL92773.1 ABC transporter permease [Saprospiraceae bacterium]